MKLASIALCVTLGSTLFAADAPKPDPKKAAKEMPDSPILTLEGPRLPILPKVADSAAAVTTTAPGNTAGGGTITPAPAVPPGLRLAPTATENAPTIPLNDASPTPVPGIYLARPYTGIVVVPPPMDEGILKPVPPMRERMPQPAPELRLTPKEK